MAEGMLSLSWNNHSSTFCHMLSTLREMERYTDVTVACDGKFYPAHKLVLSTCSDYFLKMFERTPCKHPIIVVKDVECRDIEALLSYMYAGVVSVAQNDLAQLIKAAELLQIKGLAVPDEPPSHSKKTLHMRSSSDDRSSPHAKRQRRDHNRSPSQNETQTFHSNAPSPRSSPFRRGSEHPQEHTGTNRHHNKTDQKEDQKLERRGERIEADQPDQQISKEMEQGMERIPISKESPEAQVEVLDEPLVKEEIEPESEGEVPEAGFDYGSLVSDLGVEDDGETKDHPNLPLSSTYRHASEDQPFNSQAGPSGLQGWSSMSEGGETSSQGYCGDLNQELSLSGHPGPQPQQAHHLMRLNRKEQTAEEEGTAGDGESFTVISKLHQCPYCPYNTSKSMLFMEHIQTHFSEKSYSSIHHSLLSDESEYLDDHVVLSKEKPYPCPLCPFSAAEKGGLKVHMRTHNDKRTFDCPHCPSRFAQNAHLRDHLHIHTGEKPYSCPHCSFRCANNSSIRRHIKTHTGVKPHACQHCSFRFIRMSQLKKHIRTHAKL
ncbi:uncharacterized protein [Panulirus ornatus]|uniref:uncharacterized protein isoform X1 n=1 Tax=Panulirus ornatus TaxID=150431 RepID=UPI003A8B044A